MMGCLTMRYDIHSDSNVRLEVEEFAGSAYLHCSVFNKATHSTIKEMLNIFKKIKLELLEKYVNVIAFIPVSDKKLARFAEIFGLNLCDYFRGADSKLYYKYEVR